MNLSVKEKEDQLQQLADYYTKQLKIPQIKLEFKDLTAEDRVGKYNPNNNTITINDSVLSMNGAELIKDLNTMSKVDVDEKWNKLGWMRFQVIDAVIHEARHAKQHNMIVHPNSDKDISKEEVKQWTANEFFYITTPPFENRFQSQERDAYTYAAKEMDRLFGQNCMSQVTVLRLMLLVNFCKAT